jgi:hypothetical protein
VYVYTPEPEPDWYSSDGSSDGGGGGVIIGIVVVLVVLVVLVGIAAKKYQAKKYQDAGPTPAPGIQPAPAPAPAPAPEPLVPASTDMAPVVFASPPTPGGPPKGAPMEQQTDLADLRKTAERKAQLAAQNAVHGASSPPATSSASSLEGVLSAELQPLKMPELRKRAKAAGVPDDKVDEARDGNSPKQDVIALIVAAAAAAQGLQLELEKLNVKQLRARAAAGVSGDAIEDASDGDSPKLDLISLLLAQPRAQP